MYENAEKKGDAVSLSLLGRGVLPTVKVTQRVVRFGACPCYDRRDVVVGISNTGELPIRCPCVCVCCANFATCLFLLGCFPSCTWHLSHLFCSQLPLSRQRRNSIIGR